jgi:RimJ/RimL family protein N-acetyltransferase
VAGGGGIRARARHVDEGAYRAKRVKMTGAAGATGSTPSIETERTTIRPWRVQEADRFFDIHRRIEVVRWWDGTPMQDRQQAVDRINGYLAGFAEDPRYGGWAIVERRTGVPAGTVLLKPLPDGGGEVEIGWHLHPDSWGKGFATESAAAVLGRAFADGLEEVWAVTHVNNHRSVAVCRRIGMRLLGVTDRWYHVPSLMFWVGARSGQQPSLRPERPAPS